MNPSPLPPSIHPDHDYVSPLEVTLTNFQKELQPIKWKQELPGTPSTPATGWPPVIMDAEDEIASLRSQLHNQEARHRVAMCDERARSEALADAAQAVIDRWNTPLWKFAEPTAAYINHLNETLTAWNEARKS